MLPCAAERLRVGFTLTDTTHTEGVGLLARLLRPLRILLYIERWLYLA